MPTDSVFTIDELAVYLKLQKRTLYKLTQEGTIPGHKVGKHWRFHRAVIDRWMGMQNEQGYRRAPDGSVIETWTLREQADSTLKWIRD